ncbi:MAG: hypothetical protein M1818_005455 [Claussenomyces sp. TS43310]|nr:MAG: hypothetical protein M1818_005455 [Claussenomyces sp. TS43310]
MSVGGATMFTVGTDSRMANIYGYSIILGAGTGMTFQVAYTVGGVRTMMRTGSGLDVQRPEFSQEDIRKAIAGSQSTVFKSLSPPLQKQAITAITDAMSRVYIISMSAGAVTVICAVLMKKERLFAAAGPAVVVAGGA